MWVPLVMMAASAAYSAYSGAEQARAQNKALEYNAQAMQQNAENARYEASYARAQAMRNANRKQLETGVLIGAQRAKMGASGVVVDSGSFMDLLQNTAAEGATEAMSMIHEGDVAAWRHEVRSGQYGGEANMLLSSKQDPNAVLAGGLLQGAAKTTMAAYGGGMS
ncbi:MAG: hypothetical protein FWG04_04610 [Desulfovibrionaceae bacterium]|nr:hypothetical protein [Desulfovibrionaceae bacterium]